MSYGGQSSVLPLRPLTTGELLDAAVMLQRRYGRVLLPVAGVLAAVEQMILAPLRVAADAQPPLYGPDAGLLGEYWLLFAIGCGTEAAILTLLGGLTARAAAATVLGTPPSGRALLNPRGGRFEAVLVLAALVGVVTFLSALLVPFWVLAYASFGLIVPALVVDRLGVAKAVRRGTGLAWRNGARAAGIRLLGYLSWLAIRLALGLGGLAVLEALWDDRGRWAALVGALIWALVNAVAYSSLASLDAVLHLETRMRTEGLDIWLSRAARHGPLAPHLLAVRR